MTDTILVPIDFSENAKKALLYAAHFARNTHKKIHIIYVYSKKANMLSLNPTNLSKDIRELENQLQEVSKELEADFPDLKITAACIQGDLTNTILYLLNNPIYALVIMGTKGAGKIKSSTIGSNTFQLIQQCPIGVLAVPEKWKEFRLIKLGLLSNFKESEQHLLQLFLAKLQRPVDLTCLHAYEMNNEAEDNAVNYWITDYKKHPLINNVSFAQEQIVKRMDYHYPIPRCIEHLSEQEQIDILLVNYTRKSFFKMLFGRSLPKELAHNIKIPTFFWNDDTK